MPDDLADDLQSMSFGSSDRSGSSTVSTVSGASSSSSFSSASGPINKPRSLQCTTGDPILDAVRRLRSDSGGGGAAALSMSDLRFVQRLGSGDIGSVYLTELKCAPTSGGGGGGGDGCLLVAAKVMDKTELEGRNKEGRARTEREILEAVDHPFLPRLYGVAEDEKWSCLLTEFCPGGDLHLLRQRQPGKRFDEAAVRFYASEVVAALEYIHMMGIIYRDLKPENVLVRSDGHIMLTDFDLSLKYCDAAASTPAQIISDANPLMAPLSHYSSAAAASAAAAGNDFSTASCIIPSCMVPAVSCFNPSIRKRRKKKKPGRHGPDLEFVAEPVDLRSMSFVGTHEYLAPEIVSGEGHGSTVDWWTLGVFIFELLFGVTPFKGVDNELTLANIVARALEFPKEPQVSAATKDLVAGLLVKDPTRRLGATMGAAAIKRHSFFNGVNWALLRCAAPPYVPPAISITATRNAAEMSDDSCPGTPVEYY